MEVTLNLVWLAVAAGLLITRVAGPQAPDPKINRTRWVIALVCVIALLFPAISITDDLNSGPALSGTRNLKDGAPSNLKAKALTEAGQFDIPLRQDPRPAAHAEVPANLQSREFCASNSGRRPPPAFD